MADSRLYFRQVLAGMDIAEHDPIAQQMVNFIYLIGDRETGEAVIVDPAYDPAGIIAVAEADGMKVVGALGTHYHADHVGGSLGGMAEIVGIAELLEQVQVPIHVQADEIPWITRTTSVTADHLVGHASGDTVMVGEIPITLIHTPGHTPGSQCFLVDGRLVAGDTLFLDGCGRTDLPGSDPEQMYLSLTQRLAQVPDDAVLFPGHLYSEKPSATMAETRSRNVVFRPQSLDQWLMMFAR
ncbi:MAG TPA: MBL fold metallo-hydrolase [Acidimicrobiales bacterium]|nr:MBL fold metallo-hydrolase [Acidimicrobiales bacterium]